MGAFNNQHPAGAPVAADIKFKKPFMRIVLKENGLLQ